MCNIIALFWKNAVLHMKLSDETECCLSNGKEDFYFKFEGECHYSLNITNIEKEQMLPAGVWTIYGVKEKGRYPLRITVSVMEQIEYCHRFFPYGRGNYTYNLRFSTKETMEGFTIEVTTAFYMRNKHPKMQRASVESNHILQYISKLISIGSGKVISLWFLLCNLFCPVKHNRILLLSETHSHIRGNLKALDQYIRKNHNDILEIEQYTHIYSDKSRISLFFTWLLLCWKIARCGYVITDDYAPVFKYLFSSPKRKIVQVWHAGIGFKAVGYARFGKEGSPHPYLSGHRIYDYVFVGAKSMISDYSEVFGISEDRIHAYGIPRLDGYLDPQRIEKAKADIYQQYPLLKNRKIILFAPTYRGAVQEKAYYPYEMIDEDGIGQLAKLGYVFCLKMHPFIKNKYIIKEELKDMMIDLSSYPDINELFYLTDILITDYSSNYYEFALLKKPVIFYAFDYKTYKLTRGMHRNLEELGFGDIIYSFSELVQKIQEGKLHMDGIDDYLKEYHQKPDNKASERIVQELIREGTKDETSCSYKRNKSL